MSDIYNAIVKASFPEATLDELKAMSSHAGEALDGILTGLQSLGNLMFWATDGENYGGDMAINDMRNIGEMLMNLMPVARALSDNAANADMQLNRMEGEK
ncbi:TPA: ubiquinol-cytochrome C reductase [Klebsiella quasipneumoniae subsp. quasipneumoniae]|uniref:ubiquinol-cytochrome C reductase n=1 Tax=Klebsiella quasipneumoniae TaxID=1463165 RepID=UPI000E2A759F|nr:ubiquinol-cytochrome C reductase [Klebsiella quasipneumoniae]HCI5779679.1 ubiquinol-cytochrome C reductase [Klebsiella quasipneumoniae subsp. quasipneumoniae]HCI6915956.1 ubiquinol-cytochrome C reductase [Klebsiella quasipneumoniae subsp. similipneumoniae]SXD06248.1 Uncharacterised protein [Klebsiella quasipneumoniae]HCI6119065.1 ubiquinol-cytochrome C reductase [Klebsiella quasipneumoniae subsp. quasipneumoniae]HCI6219622.1 ubiquinol-cytochrome C reductase [Klebsiella quasipneumoniae subsp